MKISINKKEKTLKVLKKEMKLLGYKNKDLAEKLNVSRQTVTNWISGICVPSAYQIKPMQNLGFSDTACLEPSKEVEV